MIKTTNMKMLKAALVFAGVVLLATSVPCDAFAASTQPLPSAGIDFALASEGVSVKAVKEEVDAKKAVSKNSIKTASKTTSKATKTPTLSNALGLSLMGSVNSNPVNASISETKETINASVLSSATESAPSNAKEDLSPVSSDLQAVQPEDTQSPLDTQTKKDTAPAAGFDAVVSALEKISEPIPEEEDEVVVEETVEATSDQTMKETERDIDQRREEEGFKDLVIAKCDGWVNVRKEPSQDSEKVGKLYDKSAGEFIEEQDGWYKISSGSCTGYVNAEYVVTGDDAVELAKEVGTRICTVDTTTLKVRGEPSTDAETLGLVPMGEVLTVSEEMDGWAKVNIEEGDGYVSLDYVKLSTEFVQAESKEEEEARLAKEERERQEAREAAAAAAAANGNNGNADANYNGNDDFYTGPKGKYSPTNVVTHVTEGGSALGIEVANYALQFNGNPYVYGGSDPVNGADCSGFVMAIYKHFGVSLPHSANADRKMGYAVNSLAEAEPGDLVCYSGHVGLYIGSGQIIHASSTKTGIKISDANYRAPLAIRRIF